MPQGGNTGLVGASVPDDWPPETLADALPVLLGWLEASPERVGWFGWYALAAVDGAAEPVLVASGGFKGPPVDGTAEIGYSVLPRFQGRGYATEMVGGLVRWQGGVKPPYSKTDSTVVRRGRRRVRVRPWRASH